MQAAKGALTGALAKGNIAQRFFLFRGKAMLIPM
jgi:hypothetical protein